MRIKSYFAPSVDSAIAQARVELGTDALLLNTRKLAGDAGQPAGYEVVFGLAGAEAPAKQPPVRDVRPLFSEARRQPGGAGTSSGDRTLGRSPEQDEPAQAGSPPRVAAPQRPAAPQRAAKQVQPPVAGDDLSGELEKLRAQIDDIRGLIVRSSTPQISIGRTVPELADVYSRLMSSGVDAEISKDIVDRLEASMATDAFFLGGGDGTRSVANRWKALRFDAERLESFVRSELETRVAIEPVLGADGEHSAVVVMVGPTGAGKTTSIMKLAASNLVAGRRVRILSLDPSRPGQNHLQSFASNLGIAFSPVPSVHALPTMVGRCGDRDLLFIDTPGYPNTGDRSAELAALAIAKIQPAEVHLVAPGYMKGTDLRRCIHKYEVFRPSRLLVTKLDETDTFGSVFSEAARAGLALSFFANGTAIPEDIRPAGTEDLLGLALERKAARAQCA